MGDNNELLSLLQSNNENKAYSSTGYQQVFESAMQNGDFDYDNLSIYSPTKKLIDRFSQRRQKELLFQEKYGFTNEDMAILRYQDMNSFALRKRGWTMDANDYHRALNNYQLDNMAFNNIVINENNINKDNPSGIQGIMNNHFNYIKSLDEDGVKAYWDKLTPLQKHGFGLYGINDNSDFNEIVNIFKAEDIYNQDDSGRSFGEILGDIGGDVAAGAGVGTLVAPGVGTIVGAGVGLVTGLITEIGGENSDNELLHGVKNAKNNFKNAMYSSTIGMIGGAGDFLSQVGESIAYATGGEESASNFKNSPLNLFSGIGKIENAIGDWLTTEPTREYKGFGKFIAQDVPGVLGSISGFMLTGNALGKLGKGGKIFEGSKWGSKLIGGTWGEMGTRALISMDASSQKFDRLRQEGKGYGNSMKGALTTGGLHWATYVFTDALPGKNAQEVLRQNGGFNALSLIKGVGTDMLSEGVEEMAEQFANDIGDKVGGIGFGGSNYKNGKDMVLQYAYTGFLGAIGGFFSGGGQYVSYKTYQKRVASSYDRIYQGLGAPSFMGTKLNEYKNKGMDITNAKSQVIKDLHDNSNNMGRDFVKQTILGEFKSEAIERYAKQFKMSSEKVASIKDEAKQFLLDNNIDDTEENLTKTSILMFNRDFNENEQTRTYVDMHMKVLVKANPEYFDVIESMGVIPIDDMANLDTRVLNSRLKYMQENGVSYQLFENIDQMKINYVNSEIIMDSVGLTYKELENLYSNELIEQQKWEEFKQSYEHLYKTNYAQMRDFLDYSTDVRYYVANSNTAFRSLLETGLDNGDLTELEVARIKNKENLERTEREELLLDLNQHSFTLKRLIDKFDTHKQLSEATGLSTDGFFDGSNFDKGQFQLARKFFLDKYKKWEKVPFDKIKVDVGQDVKLEDVLELEKQFKKDYSNDKKKPYVSDKKTIEEFEYKDAQISEASTQSKWEKANQKVQDIAREQVEVSKEIDDKMDLRKQLRDENRDPYVDVEAMLTNETLIEDLTNKIKELRKKERELVKDFREAKKIRDELETKQNEQEVSPQDKKEEKSFYENNYININERTIAKAREKFNFELKQSAHNFKLLDEVIKEKYDLVDLEDVMKLGVIEFYLDKEGLDVLKKRELLFDLKGAIRSLQDNIYVKLEKMGVEIDGGRLEVRDGLTGDEKNSGASRMVFFGKWQGKDVAIKIAHNRYNAGFGLKQNRSELYGSLKLNNIPIINPVYTHHEFHEFLIAEKVSKAFNENSQEEYEEIINSILKDKEMFNQYCDKLKKGDGRGYQGVTSLIGNYLPNSTGIRENTTNGDIASAIRAGMQDRNGNWRSNYGSDFLPHYAEVMLGHDVINEANIEVWDFKQSANWGINKDGRAVIIDYGIGDGHTILRREARSKNPLMYNRTRDNVGNFKIEERVNWNNYQKLLKAKEKYKLDYRMDILSNAKKEDFFKVSTQFDNLDVEGVGVDFVDGKMVTRVYRPGEVIGEHKHIFKKDELFNELVRRNAPNSLISNGKRIKC